MSLKAKREEWERLKGWGENKPTREAFYRVFHSEIIQPRFSAEELGATKEALGRVKAGQEVDRACPEQVSRMRNMDVVSS